MSAFTLIERLRHRRKAKGRHGIHSPFVFAFIEECLNRDRRQPLAARIARYFKDFVLAELPDDPSAWTADTVRGRNAHIMLLVPGLYRTPERKAAWEALCRRPEVRCSMDLFELGLLCFLPDFLEKQHFVLKH